MSTSKHAGLVDIPAMQEIARTAASDPAAPEGFTLVAVRGFDELIYWLERCSDKGHLENCPDLVQPWAEFDWREAPPAAVRVPQSDDMVLVPRGLIGAACHAIDRKRDAPVTLEALRRYTTGDLSAAARVPLTPAQQHADELLKALQLAKNSLVAFKFMPGANNAWEDHDEDNLKAVDAAIEAAGQEGGAA